MANQTTPEASNYNFFIPTVKECLIYSIGIGVENQSMTDFSLKVLNMLLDGKENAYPDSRNLIGKTRSLGSYQRERDKMKLLKLENYPDQEDIDLKKVGLYTLFDAADDKDLQLKHGLKITRVDGKDEDDLMPIDIIIEDEKTGNTLIVHATNYRGELRMGEVWHYTKEDAEPVIKKIRKRRFHFGIFGG